LCLQMTVASNHSEQYLAAVLISCWNVVLSVNHGSFLVFVLVSQTRLQNKMSFWGLGETPLSLNGNYCKRSIASFV